jgi:hypothetical protein
MVKKKIENRVWASLHRKLSPRSTKSLGLPFHHRVESSAKRIFHVRGIFWRIHTFGFAEHKSLLIQFPLGPLNFRQIFMHARNDNVRSYRLMIQNLVYKAGNGN